MAPQERLVDLFDATRVAGPTSSHDLNLRVRCAVVLVIIVVGKGNVALPARDNRGWSMIAVWAGPGLEDGGQGAEGEIGVDAAEIVLAWLLLQDSVRGTLLLLSYGRLEGRMVCVTYKLTIIGVMP